MEGNALGGKNTVAEKTQFTQKSENIRFIVRAVKIARVVISQITVTVHGFN